MQTTEPLPAAGAVEQRLVSTREISVAVALVLLSVVVYAVIFIGGAQFEYLFRGFGVSLPLLTKIALYTYKYCGVLSVVGIVSVAGLIRNRADPRIYSDTILAVPIVSLCVSLLVLALYFVAMYLPIFAMGATVE